MIARNEAADPKPRVLPTSAGWWLVRVSGNGPVPVECFLTAKGQTLCLPPDGDVDDLFRYVGHARYDWLGRMNPEPLAERDVAADPRVGDMVRLMSGVLVVTRVSPKMGVWGVYPAKPLPLNPGPGFGWFWAEWRTAMSFGSVLYTSPEPSP